MRIVSSTIVGLCLFGIVHARGQSFVTPDQAIAALRTYVGDQSASVWVVAMRGGSNDFIEGTYYDLRITSGDAKGSYDISAVDAGILAFTRPGPTAEAPAIDLAQAQT